jgi:DNA-binding response OmpR family regulator
MLTARDTEIDTIVGLSVGADDYVSKPFSPRELVARVRAMLRRPRRTPSHQFTPSPPRRFGALGVHLDSREAFVGEAPIMLTRTEFEILATLSSRPGMVFSRRQLLDAVWGDTWIAADNVVDVHVGHLRRKLGDDPSSPRYVVTVRGVGYRMGTGA